MPSVDTDNLDCIDQIISLKTLQRIDQNRFVIYVDKLLRDILSHSVSGASGNNHCYIHVRYLYPFSFLSFNAVC